LFVIKYLPAAYSEEFEAMLGEAVQQQQQQQGEDTLKER
jgi:hypothetical protein